MIAVPSIASFAPYLSLDECIDAASRAFELPITDIAGRSRRAPIAFVRHVAMYVAKEDANPIRSWAQIGIAFGGRDHSTVMHAHARVERELAEHVIPTMRAVARLREEIARGRR